MHAARDGDSTIVAEARSAAGRGAQVTVVTADRVLQALVGAGAIDDEPLLAARPALTRPGPPLATVTHMPALHVHGPVLPDGEVRDLYLRDQTVTYERAPGAETVARGWIVPGLVDAHCHVGLDAHGGVDEETPSGRPSPTGTPAPCCCATAAHRWTPPGCSSAPTCPG